MSEIIPLPSERLENKETVFLEFVPDSFPERLTLRIQWNFIAQRFTFEITHPALDVKPIDSFATPYIPFRYDRYIVFSFIDPSAEAERVTPTNIGESMKLFAFPGPDGNVEDE
jgi:hypothetical protein